MSDDADRAQQQMELLEQLALARRPQPAMELAFIGECHNCGEVLKVSERFCDADCRDDYQKRRRLNATH